MLNISQLEEGKLIASGRGINFISDCRLIKNLQQGLNVTWCNGKNGTFRSKSHCPSIYYLLHSITLDSIRNIGVHCMTQNVNILILYETFITSSMSTMTHIAAFNTMTQNQYSSRSHHEVYIGYNGYLPNGLYVWGRTVIYSIAYHWSNHIKYNWRLNHSKANTVFHQSATKSLIWPSLW